jgi:anti-sigma regulatory factor (Ser/Thr protein kinase)
MMSTAAAGNRDGHRHEAGFYGSDSEFRALIVPFAEEAIAAGEPVIFGYDARKAGLLRSWLSSLATVTFLSGRSLYATPARAIAAYQRLFKRHVAAGAGHIWIAGDVPHPGNGGRFAGWDRYESAVNTVWDDFPVHSLCLYDRVTAPGYVLDVVERTHPRLVSAAGEHRVSDRYQDVSAFEGLPAEPDPLERTPPSIELTGASAASVRRALTRTARGLVDDATLTDLLIGVAEAVNNARAYGRPPVAVRIWAAPGRVVARIRDRGAGPADRLLAGLVPAGSGQAGPGLGLWVMHQLDLDAALIHASDGFTVRLRAGTITG